MSRTCSQCGNNGHNSRTCTDAGGGENGIMLFGVRVTEGNSFRKSASMNNLSQYDQQPQDSNAEAGYASDDVVHPSGRCRERKRGVPWTEEEHKLFLLGLQKVASHAQKYFLRRINHNRRRRRSSLFDITADTFLGSSMDEDQVHQETALLPKPQLHLSHNQGGFPLSSFPVALAPAVVPIPLAVENPLENLSLGPNNQVRMSSKPIRPIPMLPVPPSKMADLNLNQKTQADPSPLSLKLSIESTDEQSPPATHSSAFQAIPGNFSSSGDSIISVA